MVGTTGKKKMFIFCLIALISWYISYLLVFISVVFPSGGAGYVIGKAGIKNLVTLGFKNKTKCPTVDRRGLEMIYIE